MDFIIAYYEKLISNKASAMSCCKNTAWLSVFICLSLFSSTQVLAYETAVNRANFDFDLTLSKEVEEALDNGIVLNFDCELSTPSSWWLFKWTGQVKKHYFSLTHHSLSNRYLVRFNDIQAPKNFKSASEATHFITEQSIAFFSQYAINHDDSEMRLSLNKYKLPGPMRLNAFIAEQWNINTGWITWSPDI